MVKSCEIPVILQPLGGHTCSNVSQAPAPARRSRESAEAPEWCDSSSPGPSSSAAYGQGLVGTMGDPQKANGSMGFWAFKMELNDFQP